MSNEAEMDRNKAAVAAEMRIARRVQLQKDVAELQNQLRGMQEELKRLGNAEPQGPSDEREKLQKDFEKHQSVLREKLEEIERLKADERQGRPHELSR